MTKKAFVVLRVGMVDQQKFVVFKLEDGAWEWWKLATPVQHKKLPLGLGLKGCLTLCSYGSHPSCQGDEVSLSSSRRYEIR